MESTNLTEGNVKRVLLSFAVPFFISYAMQAAYGAVDLFVVGKFCQTSAVSAVSIGSQAMQLITSFVVGISMGTTVLIGRSSGENDRAMIKKTIQSSVWILIILSFVLTLLMLLNGQTIAVWMQTPAKALAETKTYIHICSIGIPFIVMFNVNAAIMRGMGNSKTPMQIVGISGLCNVVGDFILSGMLHNGVAGVAVATAASQAVSALISLIALRRLESASSRIALEHPDSGSSRITLEHPDSDSCHFPFAPDGYCTKKIFAVGLPIAMQDTLINISFMILTLVANRRGLEASSAVGIVEKLISFMFLVPSSMMSAVSTFTAQNSGAHKYDRIHECIIFSIVVTAGFGALMCLISWTIPDILTSIFTKDPRVIEYAGEYIRSYSIDCILVGVTFALNGYLNGIGNSLVTFIHNTLAIFAVRIPAAFLLSSMFPDTMFPMGFASPLGSLFSIIFLVFYFSVKNKKLNDVGVKSSNIPVK
ncbi:MAG: MATE family efflux transporter [Lachnospiraceae bacterium]|jgi:putative MATE family efflux protein|nr:MATE family efflux transporter [Lachnospiraceae bacterium]